MSQQATITVQKVEPKTSKAGKAFWKVYDTLNRDFASFDPGVGNHAMGLVGQNALITFDEEQNGQYINRFLRSIEVAAADAPISSRTPDGAADWDVIGLRKTRCALWAAYLSSPLAAHVAAAQPDGSDKAHAIATVGMRLVEQAEFDVYVREAPNPEADPSIPF